MTQQDYEQKKRECWKEFQNTIFNNPIPISPYTAFSNAFDRAYALGREKETITREEIEKAAEKYSQSLGKSRDVTWNDGEYGFIAGANFALGKKIGISEFYDTEDTVIQGWVARDEDGTLTLFYGSDKPSKKDNDDYWSAVFGNTLEYLPQEMFPDVKWEDVEPTQIELIIKRKKNAI